MGTAMSSQEKEVLRKAERVGHGWAKLARRHRQVAGSRQREHVRNADAA
jgi:hypothetical protein